MHEQGSKRTVLSAHVLSEKGPRVANHRVARPCPASHAVRRLAGRSQAVKRPRPPATSRGADSTSHSLEYCFFFFRGFFFSVRDSPTRGWAGGLKDGRAMERWDKGHIRREGGGRRHADLWVLLPNFEFAWASDYIVVANTITLPVGRNLLVTRPSMTHRSVYLVDLSLAVTQGRPPTRPHHYFARRDVLAFSSCVTILLCLFHYEPSHPPAGIVEAWHPCGSLTQRLDSPQAYPAKVLETSQRM